MVNPEAGNHDVLFGSPVPTVGKSLKFIEGLGAVDAWSVLEGLVLGIVQGISEWLPISSKTQIMMVSIYLLKLSFDQAYAMGLILEAGTVIAAIIYFRREVWGILKALFMRGSDYDRMLLKYVVIITVATGLVGVPLYLWVSNSVRGIGLGLPMIILGLVLVGDAILITYSRSRYARYTYRRDLPSLRTWEVVLIGIAQGIAALPGVSRSGITVSVMLLLGVKPDEAFRLSFISLIPAAIGATLVPIIFTRSTVGSLMANVSSTAVAIALVVSALISLILIDALLRFARSNRIALLTVVLGLMAVTSGVLSILTGFG